MFKKWTLVTLLAFVAASCGSDLFFSGPDSGIYTDQNNQEYKVNANGPAALSVVADEELCLMFWRTEDPKIVDGEEHLTGQRCSNKTFGDLDWAVVYDYDVPNEITLLPSSREFAGNPEPLKLKMKSKGLD